ncbi:MAG: hypothetical protein FWC14_07100 [Candidatus Bathyarchaeota archaeon]|uniref:hypothetical protein n=1 Tax=Candidatus Bathycorpusculum sp. TaxID=2994959 RepID=UPI0028200186|nr:hypothetical protein [Candidatus Termiticorpusculum sp.]MCL2291914.1 hypothetical protein [Candidatus Termiticorpusculum sp.]
MDDKHLGLNVNSKSNLRHSHNKRGAFLFFVSCLLLVLMLFGSCLTSALNSSNSGNGEVSLFVLEASNVDVVVSNEAELLTAVNTATSGVSVVIALDRDITLTNSLEISEGKDITLTSTVAADKVGFYKLTCSKVASEGFFYVTIIVRPDAILCLDGIIVTHESGSTGFGVWVYGTLIMYSGEISGNTGGGVNNVGVFELYGGEISGNTAVNGGGVQNNGSFEMFGGEISGNTASSYGGGVYNFCRDLSILKSGFTLYDGIISNNHADSEGGGVYSQDSQFSMLGGTISDNTALNIGGGISFRDSFVEKFCSFDLSGGVISGNTAKHGGGGVSNIQGIFIMSGGKISKNTVSHDGHGGGVSNYLGTFKLSGGMIYSNTASNGGNDVYNKDGVVYYFGVRDVRLIICVSVVFVMLGVILAVVAFFMFKKRRRVPVMENLSHVC